MGTAPESDRREGERVHLPPRRRRVRLLLRPLRRRAGVRTHHRGLRELRARLPGLRQERRRRGARADARCLARRARAARPIHGRGERACRVVSEALRAVRLDAGARRVRLAAQASAVESRVFLFALKIKRSTLPLPLGAPPLRLSHTHRLPNEHATENRRNIGWGRLHLAERNRGKVPVAAPLLHLDPPHALPVQILCRRYAPCVPVL